MLSSKLHLFQFKGIMVEGYLIRNGTWILLGGPLIKGHVFNPVSVRSSFYYRTLIQDRISGVMVTGLDSSVEDRGFEARTGQTKDHKIRICCFPAKHAALRRKSKYWLARNQDNVYE